MKATSVAVLALISASALAQPIVILQRPSPLETRDFTDLEARKIHINWGKVGNFFKGAAKVATSILFRRDENGHLVLVARDLVDEDGELLARDFDDEYLEARDIDDYLEARGFIDEDLEARDFDDEYLEARDFDDEYLEARDFDDEYLEARDFDDEYLEARDFEDEYLEARDLEARSRFSGAAHFAHDFHRERPSHHFHFHGDLGGQQQDNNPQRRSLWGEAFRVGRVISKAHDYIPHNNNNNNNNRYHRRDLVEEGGLYDLD